MLLQQGADAADHRLQAPAGGVGGGAARLAADLGLLAGVEDDAEAFDVVGDGAVLDGPGAGGVGRQHAADGAFQVGRVGREAPPLLRQHRDQVAQHDARLDADGIGADGEDAAEVLAEIDDQAGAERFAGEAGAGAAGDEGDVVLVGVADEGADVVLVGRQRDAERLDGEGGGVGGVEGARQAVEAEFALEQSLQVFGHAVARQRVHG